nr:alcohol dehydrogenase catalytic domain-containing protein [uncultured Thiohalocapsa sp.]
MSGLVLDGNPAVRSDLPVPVPRTGDALVSVRQAGVCGSDMAVVRGYAGFRGILGHEFVGDVVVCPSEPSLVGLRVVGEINIACGHCDACRRGCRKHCERRQVLGMRGHDGAFAEYLTLPLENLHPVPAGVSDEAAVFTEPLAAALQITRQVHIGPETRVLVVGAGRLGQLIAQVLRLTGCNLAVVARRARQRTLLANVGIPWLAEDDVPAAGFDLAVEASGAPGGLALARRALRAGGTLVLKSTYAGEVSVDLAGLVVDEISVVGSRCGPFPAALRLLAQGLVDPTPLIDTCLPLARAEAALRRAAEPGVLKVLLDCT